MVGRDLHSKNFQWINQAKSETWFWFYSTTINDSVQCPEPSIQSPASGVQCPVPRDQHPESSIQSLASRVQRPESTFQSPLSRVRMHHPESSVQSPASNSYVQSPGILVCSFKLTTRSVVRFSLQTMQWYHQRMASLSEVRVKKKIPCRLCLAQHNLIFFNKEN